MFRNIVVIIHVNQYLAKKESVQQHNSVSIFWASALDQPLF